MFGRFGGDKRVAAQKLKLAELEDRLSAAQRAADSFPQLRQQFPDAWFESAERDAAVERIAKARDLLDLSHKIFASKTFNEGVDKNIELLDPFIHSITVKLDFFTATVIGRQHLWSAGPTDAANFNPSVREAQLALHGSGSSLADSVQQHIDELRPIRERHKGPWPAKLDLDNLQRHVDDARQALKIYQERFDSHAEALPAESSITLLMIAQNMEAALDMIEYERPNLAMDTVMRAAFRNSGSTDA